MHPFRLRVLPGLLGMLQLLVLRPLMLSLLGPLRLRALLLSLLGARLLRPLLLSLLDLLLRVLLRGWPRALLLPTLLLFSPALFFFLLFVLRVRRDNRREKQKQGSGTCRSNELHRNHPPLRPLWSTLHPYLLGASTLFYRFPARGVSSPDSM